MQVFVCQSSSSGEFFKHLFSMLWKNAGSLSPKQKLYWHVCRHVFLLDPAPQCRCAPRTDPPVVRSGFELDKFPDMPCMKKVHKDKEATVHRSTAKKEKR